MISNRRFWNLLVFLTCLPAGRALALAPAPEFSAEAAAVYAAADMSAAIVNRSILDPASAEAEATGLRDLTLVKAVLAAEDLPYVGIYSLPSGAWHSYRLTVMRCLLYQLKHGSLPCAGWELFPELASEAGLERFQLMSPSERVIRYSAGIDFATGRFHGRFDNPQWRPGGIYLRILTEAREPLPHGGFIDHSQIVRPGSAAAEYSVFGSRPDSVIASSFAAVSETPLPDMPPLPEV